MRALTVTVDIASDGSSTFVSSETDDWIGRTGVPLGDDICDLFFDFEYDYGGGSREQYRYHLTKTDSGGLPLPIPASFDICQATPNTMVGAWTLEVDSLDGGDDAVVTLDITDDETTLTMQWGDDPAEDWTNCVIDGTVCDLTIACDDAETLRLERL